MEILDNTTEASDTIICRREGIFKMVLIGTISFVCSFLVSCKMDKKIAIVSIVKGISFEKEDCFFSEDVEIQIKNEKYSLRSKADYDETGTISKLIVYLPEGSLEYTKEDLVNDKNILDSYGYKIQLELIYDDLFFYDSIFFSIHPTSNYLFFRV